MKRLTFLLHGSTKSQLRHPLSHRRIWPTCLPDPLPGGKLDKFDGDPVQWYKWYGQFRSAIDSGSLSNDVKLIYLKTFVLGKAKSAKAEFPNCGEMYDEVRATLKRKFRQLRTEVRKAYPVRGPI